MNSPDPDHLETPKVRREKDSIILLSERYNTPNTSLLLFHFDPHLSPSSDLRLKKCEIQHLSVEKKDIYLFDKFFTEDECAEFRKYSREATFSRSSYASEESRSQGEEPALSMNNKEKWIFFTKPPQAIEEIYKLLNLFSSKINADISTLPWDLCDQNLSASAVATNRVQKVSKASMEMGKHEDFNTETGIPFSIPVLYGDEKKFFPGKFINGDVGNPWLVSFMLYATEENFLGEEYGMGTIFCNKDGKTAREAHCRHMRFVLFEGDILHGIQESNIPKEINTWRVSYVFKLIINPKEANKSMKAAFHELITLYK